MFETLENLLQLIILGICAAVSLLSALKRRERSHMLLFFFYLSYLLGDLYWQVCLFYFDETPRISVVSDLSWYAAYLFLYLLIMTEGGNKHKNGRLAACAAKAFPVLMALFYMQWGEVLSNIIYALIMGLLFSRITGVLFSKTGKTGGRRLRRLCLTAMIFCLAEYASWTSSCFWDVDALRYTYYAGDLLMTLCFPFFIAALKAAPGEADA